MKMGNIAPRAGIEPTSRRFPGSLLNITQARFSVVTTLSLPTCI